MFIKTIVHNNIRANGIFFSLAVVASLLFSLIFYSKNAWGSSTPCNATVGDDECLCPFSRPPCETNLCPGECGVPEPGTYGSEGGVCGLWDEGNWCHRWQWCCLVCSAGDCTGALPTPTPGGPTPGPTNTPVPPPTTTPGNSVPTCTVNGPANLTVGGVAGSFIFTGSDAESNMNSLEGWWSPATVESWTNIFDHNISPVSGSYSTTQSWSCPGVGNYFVVCNAYDNQGGQCTGNPFGIPPGWASCGPGSVQTVNCIDSPPPAVTLNAATWTCTGIPTPRVDLSWTASAGADDYHVFRCTGAACLPTTQIAQTALTSYSDNTVVSGTTYNYRVRAHRHSDNIYSSYSNTVSVSPLCSSCNYSLAGSASISMLSTETYTLTEVSPPVGTVTQVNFTSTDGNIISIGDSLTSPVPVGQSSYTDATAVYSMNATAYSIGASATLRAGVIMDGFERCDVSIGVGVTNTSAWWQTKEGDLVTNGDMFSEIPGGCVTDVLCNESLIIYDTGDFPGVPQAGGSIDVGANGGVISLVYNWRAEGTTYDGPALSYSYFRNKLPSSVIPQAVAVNPLSGATLAAGGTEYPVGSGYHYYEYTGGGGLQILNAGDIDLGSRKVIVFAPGSVSIESKILVQNGLGSFVLISGGNISVAPAVSGPQEFSTCTDNNCTPDLEGIYFSEAAYQTGSAGVGADSPLHVRGIVVAWDQVVMQRDLPDNSLTPAEFFEFGYDQLMLFPPTLGERNIVWREVAP